MTKFENKSLKGQIVTVLAAAAGAAALTFMQSIANQTGLCEPIAAKVGQAGVLGGGLKVAISASVYTLRGVVV